MFHATANPHHFPNCLFCLQSSAVIHIHVHGGQDDSKPSTDNAAEGAEGAVVLHAEQRRRLLARAAAAAEGPAGGGLGLARPDNYKASAVGMLYARSSSPWLLMRAGERHDESGVAPGCFGPAAWPRTPLPASPLNPLLVLLLRSCRGRASPGRRRAQTLPLPLAMVTTHHRRAQECSSISSPWVGDRLLSLAHMLRATAAGLTIGVPAATSCSLRPGGNTSPAATSLPLPCQARAAGRETSPTAGATVGCCLASWFVQASSGCDWTRVTIRLQSLCRQPAVALRALLAYAPVASSFRIDLAVPRTAGWGDAFNTFWCCYGTGKLASPQAVLW